MAETKYVVQKFDKASHDRGAFSCGVAAMDKWIKESASELIKHNRVTIWCAFERAAVREGSPVPIVGFYALSMHSISPQKAPMLARRRERHDIPAAYLVAIATDDSHHNNGLGSALMADAMARCVYAADAVGTAAIVLDVLEDEKYERRMEFYLRLKFKQIDPENDPKRLYLSIKDAAASMAAV